MPRTIEEPITTEVVGPGHRNETKTTHPAFGQISASRVSGHAHLYDSDFRHNAFMTISISTSELHRHLNNDWHFPQKEIIEVMLSEQQWATFVSSPNAGSGVPCTLNRLQGKMVPGLPAPAARTDQFRAEMQRDLADTLDAAKELEELIDALGLPKGKAEQLRAKARTIRAKVTSSLPFVADQFEEHMEGVVEKAKSEVHGYMTNAIMRAGLTALAGPDAVLPLQIEGSGA